MTTELAGPCGSDSSAVLGVLPEHERKSRFAQRLAEESDGVEQCLWMSFCDTDRPQGQQFLGVIIMWAPGLAHAIYRSWKLGINPGGQVLSYVTDPIDIKAEHFNRLLSKQELVAAGYCDAANTGV